MNNPDSSARPVSATPLRRSSVRARLARLHEETEPLIASERRTAVRALLQHPLLTPDGPGGEAFILVRRHREWLADWFAHHADWSLVVPAEAARLRKVPATGGDASRGALEPRSEEPFSRTRYVLLCLALASLERSDRQVTLGRLAEQVTVALASEPALSASGFTWSLDQQSGRRDFVHALRLLVALGVLRRVQGDEDRLVHDRESDVLYNVNRPVLGLLLAARRSPSLVTENDFISRLTALFETPRPDTPDARNRAIRTQLARRLLDDPVLYYTGLDEEQRTYLDRQRSSLLNNLSEATGLEPEVRAEGIALADLDGDGTDLGLPEEGTDGHLTLLIATWLADRLRKNDAAPVSIEALRQQTARFIRQHKHHWRREVTERGAEISLTELVLTRLSGLGLITRSEASLHPLPALGRFALRASAELAPLEDTPDLPIDNLKENPN